MESKIKKYFRKTEQPAKDFYSPMLELYPDVFLQILNYLPAEDLTTSYQVCKKWKHVIQKNENSLWKSLYTNRWHISDEALEGLKDWKTAYFDSFNRKYSERVQLDKRTTTSLVIEKFAWIFTLLVFLCFMTFEFYSRNLAFGGGIVMGFVLTLFFRWLSLRKFSNKEGKLSNYLFQWQYFFPMRFFLHSAPRENDEQQTQKFWMLMGLQIWLFFHLRVFIQVHWFFFFFIANYLCWLVFDSTHVRVDSLNPHETPQQKADHWKKWYVKSRVYAMGGGAFMIFLSSCVPSLLPIYIIAFWTFFGSWVPFAWVIFPRVFICALMSRPQPRNTFHWFIDRFILVPSAISPIFILCLFEATQTDSTWDELKCYSKVKTGTIGSLLGLIFGISYVVMGPTSTDFEVVLSHLFVSLCGCFLGLWIAYITTFFVEYFKAEKEFGKVKLTWKGD